MAKIATLCEIDNITAGTDCGEQLAGIASTVYVGFKGELTSKPKFKLPGTGATDFGLDQYSYIESTPGFVFKTGGKFAQFDIATDSGQMTFNSIAQQKGFTKTLVFRFEKMSPLVSAILRVLNNRKDVFFVIPELDKYICIYDPDRNATIDIAYDSGTTPDSDSGVTITVNLSSVIPTLYYEGTVSTEPAA